MKANHPTLRPAGLHAAGLLLAVLGAASGTLLPSAGRDCECQIEVQWNETLTIDTDTTTDCVCVYGTLNIAPGVTLTVTGAGGNTTSTIDGTIYLLGSGSELAFTSNDQTMSGSGKIIGQHNDAKITIIGVTLTSKITIEGALTVQATSRRRQLAGADFVNNGVVDANDATTEGSRDRLTAYSGTFTGSGEYKVTAADAYLVFRARVIATGLNAPFTVSDGTFVVNENVRTTGGFTCTSPGLVDVDEANGKWFRYNYDPGPPEDYDEISDDCACPCN